MPNAKTQCQGPNATYIPLAGVGVWHREKHKFNLFCAGRKANFIFCIFSDTNMLVSSKQNSGVGGLSQRQGPTKLFCVAVEYRLKYYHSDDDIKNIPSSSGDSPHYESETCNDLRLGLATRCDELGHFCNLSASGSITDYRRCLPKTQ